MTKINKSPATCAVIDLCRTAFEQFDEIWLIGHKGDHHNNLIELGVLNDQKLTISVAHVHSSLGIRAQYLIEPPEGSSLSVEEAHTKLSPVVTKHIKRILSKGKKVCILAPFSNAGLDKAIHGCKADKNITITSPTKDCKDFFKIGNKLEFSRLIETALFDKKFVNKKLRSVLIPWVNMSQTDMTFSALKKYFNLTYNKGVYIQKDLSASGGGTKLVKSQQELDLLFQDRSWLDLARKGRLKASVEIPNAYSANGSACIVPTGDGNCIVLVDPLSHKPTGLEELQGKKHSGVGNDWSIIWPDEVQTQYIKSATFIGKMLYDKYGYTGIFGPDYVVEKTKNGKDKLRITEINPRWQGTTPYQTFNALMAKRIPLELIHYVIKLDHNGTLLGELLPLIGNPSTYNQLSVSTNGCFYIKIGSPKKTKLIKKSMNGHYLYTGSQLLGPYENIGDFDLIKESTSNTTLERDKKALQKQGKKPLIVGIRAPGKNETVGGVSLTPIGYIVGKSKEPIFLPDQPGVTDYGKRLYQLVVTAMFNN